MTDTKAIAQAIWEDTISPLVARLKSLQPEELPIPEESIEALAGCLSKRGGNWRRTKPQPQPARLLWELVRFHRGSGSLWGFPWFADPQQRSRLDTLALLLLGNRSSALDAWARVLGRGIM